MVNHVWKSNGEKNYKNDILDQDIDEEKKNKKEVKEKRKQF